MVERNLAKVEVASSSLVSRSKTSLVVNDLHALPGDPCYRRPHFLVESQNNFELNGSPQVSADNGQYLDTIQVPFWDQNPNHPFPSVTLRIDFRGNDIGDFVFHCHILNHEDLGMMNIVRVRPSPASD